MFCFCLRRRISLAPRFAFVVRVIASVIDCIQCKFTSYVYTQFIILGLWNCHLKPTNVKLLRFGSLLRNETRLANTLIPLIVRKQRSFTTKAINTFMTMPNMKNAEILHNVKLKRDLT